MSEIPLSLEELHDAHVSEVIEINRATMGVEKVDALVIGSGGPEMTYQDDDHGPSAPVAANFARLAPMIERPNNHAIVIGRSDKPTLLYHAPQGDFWRKSVLPPDGLNRGFDVREIGSLKELEAEIERLIGNTRAAFLGPNPLGRKDAKRVKCRLEHARRFKTDHEIACAREASKTAALGHFAAKEVFLGGGSELEMHLAFLRAAGATESQLAFQSTISLDADTAFLHRPEKDPNHRNGGRALVDAGTRFRHMNSDITTTWVKEGVKVHPVYIRLLQGLEKIQKGLCSMIKTGVEFISLHEKAHLEIAKLLIECEVIKDCTPEEAVERRYIAAFLPHGLGHLLGIQTHDKGGKQAGPKGGTLKPPSGDQGDPMYDWLRKLNPLAERELVTVEPGIYFFPELLARFRSGEASPHFNWGLIDQLDGGMRIESDVLVLANGFRNLTTEALGRNTNV